MLFISRVVYKRWQGCSGGKETGSDDRLDKAL